MNKKQELTYKLQRLCESLSDLEISWNGIKNTPNNATDTSEEVVLSIKGSNSKKIILEIPKDALLVHYSIPYAEAEGDESMLILLLNETYKIYLQSKGLLVNISSKDTDKFIEKIKQFFKSPIDGLLDIANEGLDQLKE